MGRKKLEYTPEPCLFGGRHVQWFGISLERAAEVLDVSRAAVNRLVLMGALKTYWRNGERSVSVAYDDFAGNTGFGDFCKCVLKLLPEKRSSDR